MILYNDTKKELFFDTDYKRLPDIEQLLKIDCTSMIELLENLYAALNNADIYHADLFAIALCDDIVTLQKIRIEQYIRTVSSGHMATVINNTKYTEIDKALMNAIKYLQEQYTEDIVFIDIGTDIQQIDNFIRESYQKEQGK